MFTRSHVGSGSPSATPFHSIPLHPPRGQRSRSSNPSGERDVPSSGNGQRLRSSTTPNKRVVTYSPGDGRAAITAPRAHRQTQSARKPRTHKKSQALRDALREAQDEDSGLLSVPSAVANHFEATEIPTDIALTAEQPASFPDANTTLSLASVHQAQQDTARQLQNTEKQLQSVLQAISALTTQVHQSTTGTTPSKPKPPPKGSLEAFRTGTPGYLKSKDPEPSTSRSPGDVFDMNAPTPPLPPPDAPHLQPAKQHRGFNIETCTDAMIQTLASYHLHIFPTTTPPAELFTTGTSSDSTSASGHFANEQALFDMGDLGLQALYSDPTARDLGVPLHWMKYFTALQNEYRDRKSVLTSGKHSPHEAIRTALNDVSAIHMAHFRRLATYCWYPHPSPLDPQEVARAAPPRTRRSTAGSALSNSSKSSAKLVTNKTVVNGVTTWKCEHHKDKEKIAPSHTTATCKKGAGGGD